MKSDKLADAIGMVGDDLILDAHASSAKKKPHWKGWSVAVAAILVLAISIGTLSGRLFPSEEIPPVDTIFAMQIEAEYPDTPQYPIQPSEMSPSELAEYEAAYDKWSSYINSQRVTYLYSECDLSGFLSTTIPEFLTDDSGKNMAYSPLNLYIALGMLAEITDGNSRSQILDLLGTKDMEKLREQTQTLWNTHYIDDGISSCILASSMWLDDDYSFKKSTLEALANNYYASSYQGEADSTEFQQELRNWLNEQTGDLLKESANSMPFPDDMIMTLATTLYFEAEWKNAFSPSANTNEVFHGYNGDVTCEFMHSSTTAKYYWGENFSATAKELKNGGKMYFLLPDEGVSTNEVLTNAQALELILNTSSYENVKSLVVNLSLPKFDISSQIDFAEQIQSLGITDVFLPGIADFSPLLEDSSASEMYVNNIDHNVRVMIDEKGCTAAAYTAILMPGGAMPPDEEVDFCLDRPFVFIITSSSDLPLFIGVINTP